MPAAGVELRELSPRQCVGTSVTIARAIERIVVKEKRDAVGGELHVDFHHPITVRLAESKRSQRVLGGELAGTAMRGETRIRPGRESAHRLFLESRSLGFASG